MYPSWPSRPVLEYGILPVVLAGLLWIVLAHPSSVPGWAPSVVFGCIGGYCVSVVGDLVRLVIRRTRRSTAPPA
jgi:hypothetical protein